MTLEEILVENIVFLPPEDMLSLIRRKINGEIVTGDRSLKTLKGDIFVQYWSKTNTFSWKVDPQKAGEAMIRYGLPFKEINILVEYQNQKYIFPQVRQLEFFADGKTGMPEELIIRGNLILAYAEDILKGTFKTRI